MVPITAGMFTVLAEITYPTKKGAAVLTQLKGRELDNTSLRLTFGSFFVLGFSLFFSFIIDALI